MSPSLVVSLAVTSAIVCGAAAWFLGPWRRGRTHTMRFMFVSLVAPLIGFLVAHGWCLPTTVAVSYLESLVPVGIGLLIALVWKLKSDR